MCFAGSFSSFFLALAAAAITLSGAQCNYATSFGGTLPHFGAIDAALSRAHSDCSDRLFEWLPLIWVLAAVGRDIGWLFERFETSRCACWRSVTLCMTLSVTFKRSLNSQRRLLQRRELF